MTLVNRSLIRQDMLGAVERRIPTASVADLYEGSVPPLREDVAPPLERSTTTLAKTLPEFYELFRKILSAARENDGLEYEIGYSKEYPSIATTLPCFTTALIGREPYSLNGRRELAPRFMQENSDEDYPGDIIQQYQRRQVNTVRITIWAKTAKVADELADWVEDKFFEYLWVFQWAGLSHPVEWVSRGSDIREELQNQQIYGAPMTFRVITSKITQRRETALRSMALKVGILIDEEIGAVIEEDLRTP